MHSFSNITFLKNILVDFEFQSLLKQMYHHKIMILVTNVILVTTIAQSVIVGQLRHQPVSTGDRQSINNFHIYIFKLQSWSC